MFNQTQSIHLQKLQNTAARIILDMSNKVNHSTPLRELGRESLKTERKKAKAKTMHKIFNKMSPKSLANLFSHKSEKTDYITFEGYQVISAYQNLVLIIRKIVSCMMEPNFGILHQKILRNVNRFLPFKIKSLLTLMSNKYCK